MGKFMSTMRLESYEETQDELRHLLGTISGAMDLANGIITDVDSTLLNYDIVAIDRKVENWLCSQRPRLELVRIQEHEFAPAVRECCETKLLKIARKMKSRLRGDYNAACSKLRIFKYSMNELTDEQREIHENLLELNNLVPDDVTQCWQKLVPLRAEVIKNVRKSKKKGIEYRRIHEVFNEQVLEIHSIVEDLGSKKVEELILNRR